jgi:histidinol dehydrogenase
VQALAMAAERVHSFHLAQRRHSRVDFENGLGILLHPVERAGLYVPGGTACYPSTVLMTAIPAKVAGVREVILTTPPGRDGSIPPPTLVAADLAKVDRIFKLGGAQAIAALALGTESVPKVDKICGPGNIFVTLAKKKVFGIVDIDGLHGPTETLLLADDSADAKFLAADLLAQAEHDEAAAAILITTSSELAKKVAEEIERQLAQLERRDIAGESLKQRGGIVVVQDMEQAIELANYYAPEHLSLIVRNPWSYLGKVHHAGGIFVGMDSPEVLGDYVAGPSHVMPTGGTARFFSVLGLADFLRVSSIVALDSEALKALGPAAAAIARAEGLTAHARAVEMRLKVAEEKED